MYVMGSALLAAGLLLVALAALHDVAARTVPNGLALLVALAGFGLRAARGDAPTGLFAAAAVFALAAFCWRRGWMGGGDVKLLGAAALLVPPGESPALLAAVAVAGGVLAVPYLVARRRVAAPAGARPTGLLARALRAERWRLRRGGPLPYAVAIAAGVLFVALREGLA